VTPYFSEKALDDLYEQRGRLVRQYLNLMHRLQARNYSSDRGREYAFHGFGRRLDLLRTAIDQVFTALPPEREGIPEHEELLKATIAIQAFVLNVVGCLDNLAWIWVYERDIRAANGTELNPKLVGLFKRHVQETMSKQFRAYLNSRKPWFDSITSFRDPLAHRIPLYIPPYTVAKSKLAEHSRLEQEATAALARGDHAAYDQARDHQKQLGEFRPWITHSFHEQSGLISFHHQLLCDWLTIEELGLKLLEELDPSF
jgi:hypothetical protein